MPVDSLMQAELQRIQQSAIKLHQLVAKDRLRSNRRKIQADLSVIQHKVQQLQKLAQTQEDPMVEKHIKQVESHPQWRQNKLLRSLHAQLEDGLVLSKEQLHLLSGIE